MAGEPRVTAVYLLRDDGAALLQHRDDKPGISYPGLWTPPGGHCEDGESVEECARRELHEETGYLCGALSWLRTLRSPDASDPAELTVFWSRYDGVQPVTCYEGQDLRFLSRATAGSLAMPRYLVELWDAALVASAEGR